MTESTLQHEGSPYEGITISSEDSDFDDLRDGEEIRDDEVILGSSQGTMYRSGGRLMSGRLGPLSLKPEKTMSLETEGLKPEIIEPERRARPGTGGNQGAHSRGHSRNLSTSSIAYPTSTSGQPLELRRRPPPLIMANDTSAAIDDHAMDGATTPRANSNGEPAPPDRSSPADQHPDTVTKSSRDDGPARAPVSGHSRTTSTMSDYVMNVDSDGERDGSDQETEPGAPPSKKRKTQRFFCTDFPPCNLSFTRSEHLARHIRKHTGERPFQCHCSRRFSRLDNLRQHAQTVHVNEEIPGDSLAATGTRFQSQVRTDRVRPPGRARAGTGGSQGVHSHGHSRNLSTSSIESAASTFSQPPELRRRPPPLIMANNPTSRARLGLDPMGEPPSTPPGQICGIPGPSAGGSPYTPSNVYTGGPTASPQYTSPMSSATHGFWEGKTAARRLSVPTSSNPFLAQHPGAYPPPSGSPAAPPGSYSNAAGVFASPTSTNYTASRDESTFSAAEAEMRTRTWHPSSYAGFPRPSTSGLSHYHTPDTVPPSFGGTNSAEQLPRLPGIESFDADVSQHRPHRSPPPIISDPSHSRGHASWDMSLHHNLTGLDIQDRRASRDASQWSQQTIAELQNVSSGPSSSYQPTFPPTVEHSPEEHRGHVSNLSTSSHPAQTSPEDSSSSEGVHTPSTASVEYHPAILHSSGYIESHNSSYTPSNVYPGRIEPENLEPENLEPENLEPENLEPENLEPENLEPENLEPENLEPENLEPENLEPENLEPENLEPENLEPENLEPENLEPENLEPENLEPEEPRRLRLELDKFEKFQSLKREQLYMASSDVKATVAIPRSNEVPQFCEDKLGNARLGYGLKLVRHGLYDESPSSLIILDFDFNYDNTCAITKADITIVLGSRITEQPVKPTYGSIVPFATDMRWPSKASGPSSDTEISNETLWKLKLGAQGYSLETPEKRQSVSGKKTDSSWRIAGGPVFVDKPFRCRRGFLWRVDGHEFNRFPIPEIFSLGMIVRHDMVDYWVKVKIDGSLRGRVRNSVANLRAWSSRRSTRWMIHPTESTAVLEKDLVTEMQGRYRKIFTKLPSEHEGDFGD
ncbi:transcriptional regulator family: C2H2 zinc finger [Penicillium canescens]|nr:transcriptional regulator family: C2H2 zinc finger [Penicillium canescens]